MPERKNDGILSLNVKKLHCFCIYKYPSDEIMDACIDNLYNGNENPPNVAKHDFFNLLNIATKESFF